MSSKFIPSVCGKCGASLAKKKPKDVELMATRRSFEEPFPDRYAAKCPFCGDYNLVTAPSLKPEPEVVTEPEN